MNRLVFVIVMALLISACGGKKKVKKDTSNYFPIRSFLQSQVKQIDTTLNRITMIETANGRSDTSIIDRGKATVMAREFIDIPDLKDPKVGQDYTESNVYDSVLGMVSITYLADDDDLEITRQEMHVVPTFSENDQPKSFYLEKYSSKGKETIEKKLIWEVNRYFQIRTIVHVKNEPDSVHDVQVFWQNYL